MDNRLAHMDQASYLGLRALGHGAIVQFTWIYDRPVRLGGLRRFHRNLGYGLLGRRIERSTLPFARDRWVAWRGPADVELYQSPRPRGDLIAWGHERARLPLDPEYGPGWHTGVLPLEDGGTAVCLTTSHTLIDGLGILQAVSDAAGGRARHLGYPGPASRTLGSALREDGRHAIASAPELARAAAATARIARRRRKDVAASIASAPPSPRVVGDDRPVVVPCVVAHADAAEWDAHARSIAGNSFTLVAAFAGRLGVRMGRLCDDGSVTLSFPVSDRTEDDTRGNALVCPTISIDPARLSTDLSEVRIRFKQAFADLEESARDVLAPLPLTSVTPKWAARWVAGIGLGTADSPIGCSNVGDLPALTNRPDGTDADYAFGRLIEPGITRRALERMGGQLFVASGRVHGKIWIAVNAYLPGRTNTQQALREDVSRTFDEFGLTAELHG